jgi:hypothetical protein
MSGLFLFTREAVNSGVGRSIFLCWRISRMTLVQSSMNLMAKRMPKIIDPKTHAVLDYVVAGIFIAAGVIYWKRNRRAAVSSFVCGAATATNALVTDFPGGVWKVLDYRKHGRIDAGLVGAVGTMPTVMGFADADEARFFKVQSIAEAAVTALTDFDAMSRFHDDRREEDAA